MAFDRRDVEPEEELQDLMHAFGELFEGPYGPELLRLATHQDEVFSFEVEWGDLMENEVLRHHVVDDLDAFMNVGERVLNDRFKPHMASPCRLVLRLTGLPASHHRRLDELRMRDRDKLYTFDVAITRCSPPMGYLRTAVYVCKAPGCDYVSRMEQRLARERESPNACPLCVDRMMKAMELDDEQRQDFTSFAANRGIAKNFGMVLEELRYIDVQYLSVVDVRSGGKEHWDHGAHDWTVVVDEDHVAAYNVGSMLRLHATVHVDHLPDRTFAKDTRRTLVLRVEGIEPLDADAAHVDDVSWLHGPPI